MRSIFLFSLAVLAHSIVSTADSSDGKTANNPRSKKNTPSPSDQPVTIQQMTENHLKMGRVLDALDIYRKLYEQKLSSFHVVSNIWGHLKPNALFALAAFDTKYAMPLLKQLELELPKIPTDDDSYKLNELEKSLKSTKGFNATIFGWIRSILLDTSLPGRIESAVSHLDKFELRQLKWKVAKPIKKLLIEIKSGPIKALKVKKALALFNSRLSDCQSVLISLKNEVIPQELVDKLKRLFEYGSQLIANRSDFDIIQKAYSKDSTMTKYLKGFSTEEVLEDATYFRMWFRTFSNPPGLIHYGASFNDQSLDGVYKLLEDPFVKKMLNDGKSLEFLRKLLVKNRPFFKQFANVDYQLDRVANHKNAQLHLDYLVDFGEDMKALQWLAVNTGKMANCVQFEQGFNLHKLRQLRKLDHHLAYYYAALHNMSAAIENIQNNSTLEEVFNRFSTQSEESQNIFENGSPELNKLVSALQDVESIFENLINYSVTESINVIKSTKEGLDILKSTISLDEESCKSWEPMDIDYFSRFNAFPKTLQRVKSGVIVNLRNLYMECEDLAQELKHLKNAVIQMPTANINGHARELFIRRETLPHQRDDGLMQIGNIFRTLHKLNVIYEHYADEDTLLDNGDYVVSLIDTVEHRGHRKQLREVWKKWDEEKYNFLVISSNARKVNLLFNTTTELSVKEIGRKYLEVAYMKYTKSSNHHAIFNFGEKIETLRFFNQSDKKIATLRRLMMELKEPLTVDWRWVGARFGKTPLYMEDVAKAMKLFFEKPKKRAQYHPDFIAWNEEKKQREEAKKNRTFLEIIYRPEDPIDWVKLLGTLAVGHLIGWILALPCLCPLYRSLQRKLQRQREREERERQQRGRQEREQQQRERLQRG